MSGIFEPFEILIFAFLIISPVVLALIDIQKRDLPPKVKRNWILFILLFLFLGAVIYGLIGPRKKS